MIFVIGARGRLGQAIHKSFPAELAVVVDREVYEDWWRSDSPEKISRFFAPMAASNSTIFIAAGVLDPRLALEDHLRVNFILPQHIIEGASRIGLRAVTFGTAMELLVGYQNPYVQSKRLLADLVNDLTYIEIPPIHIRIHTLYGTGTPSPFMFLGQIYAALRDQAVFEMSSGEQLREYHHIDDDVDAIHAILESGLTGVVDLSHGDPVNLKELAMHIFDAFYARNLLRVGALPQPKEENYATVFRRPSIFDKLQFRKTLPAVTNYLQHLLAKTGS